MRIALACPYAWDAPGGVQHHVRELALHLRDRGHRTLTLAPGRDPAGDPGVVLVGRPVRVRFNRSVVPICPDPRSWGRIRAALEAFGPDLLHAHEPFSPSTGLLATLAARVPVVATSHTYFERSLVFLPYVRALRAVWRRPAVWVAVSQASAAFLRRHLGAGASVRVVPNGVAVERFRRAEPAALPPGRRVLFVGRLDPRKGFPVALRALALLAPDHPDLLLVVAGDGPDRRAVDRLPGALRDRVVMLGTVRHADLPPYLAACQVLVAPATGRESFGIVLVEAMAAGLPVVASDIPGYREVVRDGVEGLLVPPTDPAATAAALRRVLADPALAARLGEAGRDRAERFRWEAVAGEVEEVYGQALAAGGREAR